MYQIKSDETVVLEREHEADAYRVAAELAQKNPGAVLTVWKDGEKKGMLVSPDGEAVSNKFTSLNKVVHDAINLTPPANRGKLYLSILNSPKFIAHRIQDNN